MKWYQKLSFGAQCFAAGILVTVLVIGCAHIEIRFSRGPEAFELSQTEKVAEQLAYAMPATKPRVK